MRHLNLHRFAMRKPLTSEYKKHMYDTFGRAIVICAICIVIVIFASAGMSNKNISGHVDNVLLESNDFVIDARMCNIDSVYNLQTKMYERIYNEQKNQFYHFANTVLDE